MHRSLPRVTPPCVVASTVERADGSAAAIGVITDISPRGACLWSDVRLVVGETLRFQIHFVDPGETHVIEGRVVWARNVSETHRNTAQCGVEWVRVDRPCASRLAQLTARAVAPEEESRFLFERRWTIKDGWPSPFLDDLPADVAEAVTVLEPAE